MSDFVTTANALRTQLATFTTLPIVWPNSDVDVSLAEMPIGFVYAEIGEQDERPIQLGTTGNRQHRMWGELAIYLYVPTGSLVGTAEGYAQTIRALFAVDAVSNVVITRKTIGAGRGAVGPGGRFYCVPVIVNFWADRTE